jgi:type IV secretion system protein VirB10
MSTPPPPPPPPEDPFANLNNGENPDPFAIPESEPLDEGRPSVAAAPGRVKLVIGIIGAVILFLLYNIFSGGKDDEKPVEKPKEATVAPATPVAVPPLPTIEEPPVPPNNFTPPPIPQATNVTGLLEPKNDSAEKERQQARMRSDMFIMHNSGSSLSAAVTGNSDEAVSEDANLDFASKVGKANTKADRVVATRIGNLQRTIAQGRIIQATTESIINTELPGPVRAIVSRDVFAEAGTQPLIPKGSRLIGTYNTSLLGGQSRVYLVWTRVIRPDGVDVMINSPLVDQLGQAGIGGQVDTKFQQIFSRAIMSSLITIGVAIGSDEITGGGTTSTTNSSIGGTTQSGDGATTATVNALNRLGSTTDSFLQRYLNLGPSILVDQGTKVNVFVNRDLVFPNDASGARVIE